MPPAARTALKVGDVVSVPATMFGQEWAKATYASDWHRKKLEGKVVGKASTKWRLSFQEEGEAEPMEIKLARTDITFVRRPVIETVEVDDDEDEDEAEEPVADSSDEDEESFFNEEPDHSIYSGKTGQKDDAARDIMAGWKRDDEFCQDQRAKFTTAKDPPKLNMINLPAPDMDLFTLGCLFLPMAFLALMAVAMTDRGRELKAAGNAHFPKDWTVTTNDLLQWIGVWMYMLAFHQAGDRRQYWEEPPGGFGPRHKLQAWLALGQNGEKGVQWFESMSMCFILPEYTRGDKEYKANDPFTKTRRWWNALRDGFYAAVTASWLLVLDESMVQWQGRGMPGLMVILRKPTPIGLELHTLCCALCGILIWFEVYEGKGAMAVKEYCDRFGKSIALTLRLTKPFHSTGRVLIADSWFGSVACAIALFNKGIYAVMNVKTATKNYPKDQLMEVVGEIKGNTAENKKARRERRGKSIAFTQEVEVNGARNLTLLAAGHNKKVPLLLICTAFTMLPGDEHNKTWKVNNADGSVSLHSIKTEQPDVHALYRLWMNIVDIHNKLRQGVVSMADVWGTIAWDKRHFAEGLGFWEVNVYKAFVNFCQAAHPKKIPHGDFRARLAWAFLTLGRCPYPTKDRAAANSSAGPSNYTTPGGLPEAPLPGATHSYVKTPGTSGKTCRYCGAMAYQMCKTCEEMLGCPWPVCGSRSKRGIECMELHAAGAPCQHGTFNMTSPGKRAMKAGAASRKAKEKCDDTESADDDDDDAVPTSPSDGTRAKKRAKKAQKAKKKAAEAAAAEAAKEAEEKDRRAARAASRSIERE
jgi:hypothetical protein